MGGPFPQHGVRHAALDLAQGGPPPRTPGDRAHRLGSVSPLPALPALSSRCASLRRGQSKPCGLRHPPAPPHASLALAGQRLTSPAGCVSSHTSLAAQRGEAATPPLRAQPAHLWRQPEAHWPRQRPHVRERSRVTTKGTGSDAA
jgi:hypothetical protein